VDHLFHLHHVVVDEVQKIHVVSQLRLLGKNFLDHDWLEELVKMVYLLV
jgi:hypothetical protein